MVVEANVTFVGTNTELVYNGHVAGDGEVVLDGGVEEGRGGGSDKATGIIAVGVSSERRR